MSIALHLHDGCDDGLTKDTPIRCRWLLRLPSSGDIEGYTVFWYRRRFRRQLVSSKVVSLFRHSDHRRVIVSLSRQWFVVGFNRRFNLLVEADAEV